MNIKNSQSKRLEYIDTCKGLLIVMLIFCHINSMAREILPANSMAKMYMLGDSKYLYVPYFMQTFFFITGFCSNYSIPIKSFLINNAKALIIPLLVFATIDQLFNSIVFNKNFLYVEVLGKEFFYLMELFWFLPALFLAKVLMLCILKITNKTPYQIGIVCAIFMFATYFIKYRFHAFNYFHWHNSLSMLPFLYIGYLFKRYDLFNKIKKLYIIGVSVSYFAIIFLLYITNRLIPYYTHFHHYTYVYVLVYLWLAFSGSIMILNLSKMIPNTKFITYLGKNTIVVYGMHFTILSIVIILLKKILVPLTFSQALFFYITTAIITILGVYLLCHVFQRKPFAYLIGRF